MPTFQILDRDGFETMANEKYTRLAAALVGLSVLTSTGCEEESGQPDMQRPSPAVVDESTPSPEAPEPPRDPRLDALLPAGDDSVPTIPEFVAAEVLEDPESTEPRIALLDGHHRLVLPAAAARLLFEQEPRFEVWTLGHYWSYIFETRAYDFDETQAIFAVIGDFNGDGRTDALADGHNSAETVTLVFLSSESGYELHELDRRPARQSDLTSTGESRLFLKAEPGRYAESVVSGDRSVELTTDGIVELFFERASVLHYFVDGEWRELILSD